MYFIIKRYMDNLSINDLNNLALSNGIVFSDKELEFSYEFVKKNWSSILSNKGLFDINKYKERFSDENFKKLNDLYKEMLFKYGNYLK